MALFAASDATDDKWIGAESYKRKAHDNTDNNTGDSSTTQFPS
jgi:hypothetical protein